LKYLILVFAFVLSSYGTSKKEALRKSARTIIVDCSENKKKLDIQSVNTIIHWSIDAALELNSNFREMTIDKKREVVQMIYTKSLYSSLEEGLKSRVLSAEKLTFTESRVLLKLLSRGLYSSIGEDFAKQLGLYTLCCRKPKYRC